MRRASNTGHFLDNRREGPPSVSGRARQAWVPRGPNNELPQSSSDICETTLPHSSLPVATNIRGYNNRHRQSSSNSSPSYPSNSPHQIGKVSENSRLIQQNPVVGSLRQQRSGRQKKTLAANVPPQPSYSSNPSGRDVPESSDFRRQNPARSGSRQPGYASRDSIRQASGGSHVSSLVTDPRLRNDDSRGSSGEMPNMARPVRNFGDKDQIHPTHYFKHSCRDFRGKSQLDESCIPQLVQEIEDKLVKGAIECMICYEMVRRSAPIWSCSSCYSIFHLNCIRKWARAPTSVDISAEKEQGMNWRCPGCQAVQLISSKDIRYSCFCGKQNEPSPDHYLIPHSCGEPCGKPLDREADRGSSQDEYRCSHVCVLQCHPGPCPPCKTFAPPRPCPCGKITIARRCSDRSSSPSCGLTCSKILECGRHFCSRICHLGPCDPCQILVNASCFCKKKTEVIPCQEISVKGVLEVSEGLFSCNSVCNKILSCGKHTCSASCHPGPCGECELTPDRIRTCCCGKTSLMAERKSCVDPIPVCTEICGKALACGIHQCKERCHQESCPPCMVLVEQRCRCKSTVQMIECCKMTDESFMFLCEKPCGKKKNCGRHRCTEKCCPSSIRPSEVSVDWNPHLCLLACGKKLRCGQHMCHELCHLGHCPPCLETIFSELSCACGKTVISPPLPCGTPLPSCQHPCSIWQQCGHSATHSCHFGDCPPCSIPVSRECIGGHVMLRNVPCGAKEIRCNQLCGKTRQCGIHACARICHPMPCDTISEICSGASGKRQSCGQVCGAPRRDCRHTCTSTCHPHSLCPDLRCDFPVTVTCSCGRLTASVPCDAGGSNSSEFHLDPVFEAAISRLPSALQPVDGNGKRIPLGQRKLACDDECARLERKKVLAEAFDISFPNIESLHLGDNPAVAELISDLLRREPKWVTAIEERFKFLVLGKMKGSTNNSLKIHVFSSLPKERRDVVKKLAERWKLAVQSAGWEPKRFLVVHATLKSKAPARIIGTRSGISLGVAPMFDPHVDMDPKLVVSFLDLPREANISALVLRFGGECELVWLNDKNALAVFSDTARAATASRRLDYASVYHGAVAVPPASSCNSAGLLKSTKDTNMGMASSTHTRDSGRIAASWLQNSKAENNSASQALISKENVSSGSILSSANPWIVLSYDSCINATSDSNLVTNGGYLGHQNTSGALVNNGEITNAVQTEEVDDWEEAYH